MDRINVNKIDTSLLDKLEEQGLISKSVYSLPKNDTIGSRLFKLMNPSLNKR